MYYFLRWQRLCQHMIHKKRKQRDFFAIVTSAVTCQKKTLSKLVIFEKKLKSQPLKKKTNRTLNIV